MSPYFLFKLHHYHTPIVSGKFMTHTNQSKDTLQTTHFGYEQVPVDEKVNKVADVFHSVADKYDLMNDIMSLGSHRLWKKQMISWLSPNKNTVLLDMSSGTGDIAKLFLKHIKNKGTVYAVDPNSKMMEIAKKNLSNIII